METTADDKSNGKSASPSRDENYVVVNVRATFVEFGEANYQVTIPATEPSAEEILPKEGIPVAPATNSVGVRPARI